MTPKTAKQAIKSTTMETFNHVVIEITNFHTIEMWFLILVGVLILIISVLCGIWCLVAAKNVKNDGKTHFDDDDESKGSRSRSTAGSDFSVIEVEELNVENSGGIRNYLNGIGKSLMFKE
ncbi:hypothetical protein L3Y34_008066 [Caenorhabditis briggsae]|uniref:Uncharacterized protein n=1 Tax=Caenorhabditis briggsae TaxID=6238 RepID=A0AAE9CZN9_CAEBR|nr:hypothetical protein L3Y34_008066 [Caenorhabditis briggsae]